MLTVVRKGIFTRDFDVVDGRTPFADVEFPGWGERATLRVNGTTYEARREGWLIVTYLLERGGTEIARAEPTGFWSSAFRLTAGTRTLTLARKGFFRAAFSVVENEREVGEVVRRGFWRSTTVADLPADLEAAVRAFVLWLAVIRWRAQEGAAAAS